MTALSLVMVLLSAIAAQTFHQHQETSTEYTSKSAFKLKSSEHCKVCDHFHHHSSPAISEEIGSLSISSTSFEEQTPLPFEEITCTLGLDGYINKGPPAFL